MKILYLVHQFYPSAYTGTEKFVLQLAQVCQAAGHEVKVVTYDLPGNQEPALSPVVQGVKQRLKSTLQRRGLDPAHLRNLPIRLLPNPVTDRSYCYQGVPVVAFAHQRRLIQPRRSTPDRAVAAFARQLLQREQPDLIHAGHTLRVTEFLTVAAELGIPYLLTLTDFWVICPNCKLINEQRQICNGPYGGKACQSGCPTVRPQEVTQRLEQMRHLLQQAASVVAPARFLAHKVEAELGPLGLTVIPYGIDTQGLTPNLRYYPTVEPLRFCFAGALLETKGIEVLLAAFQALPSPTIYLEIYGSGPMLAKVRQAVQADQRITYGGRYEIAELNALLNRVDVVIVPSLWHENLPLIMQEAQAAGVPTLVSDVGGMTECITDGVNGFTFRVGDVADLQRKLQMLIDRPEILNQIKENIRSPKSGQYRVTSLGEEAAMYLEQYERILAKPQRVMG